MEKDVDEVVKIARNVKAKLEAISKDVILNTFVTVSISMLSYACWPTVAVYIDFLISLSRT